MHLKDPAARAAAAAAPDLQREMVAAEARPPPERLKGLKGLKGYGGRRTAGLLLPR